MQVERNPRRVCIAGAGLSGLYAAWLLQSRGWDVRVHEASGRPGGALHPTLVPDVDFMSQFFHEGQEKVQKLCEELSLTVVPRLKNKYVDMRTGEQVDIALQRKEDMNGPVSLYYDVDALKQLPYFEEMKTFLFEDYFDGDAAWGRESQTYFVKEGYVALVEGLLTRLGDSVVYNSQILMAQQTEDGVLVTSSDKGLHHCAKLIFAVPTNALRTVATAHPTTKWMLNACDASFFVRSARAYIQFDRPVFTADEVGTHFLDHKRHFKWATSLRDDYVLVSYVDGENADKISRLRRTFGAAALANFLAKDFLLSLNNVRAKKHKNQRGLYIQPRGKVQQYLFTPDTAGFHSNLLLDFYGAVKLHSGDIALAGESTADPKLRAWMEGALQSAERAVMQINQTIDLRESNTI